VTCSQFAPPESVAARVIQFICPWPTLRNTERLVGTTPPPETAVNVSPVCETRMLWRPAVTVAVTGMFRLAAPKLTTTAPVYVPGPRPAGLAVTVIGAGDVGSRFPKPEISSAMRRRIGCSRRGEGDRSTALIGDIDLPCDRAASRRQREREAGGSTEPLGGRIWPTLKTTGTVRSGRAAPPATPMVTVPLIGAGIKTGRIGVDLQDRGPKFPQTHLPQARHSIRGCQVYLERRTGEVGCESKILGAEGSAAGTRRKGQRCRRCSELSGGRDNAPDSSIAGVGDVDVPVGIECDAVGLSDAASAGPPSPASLDLPSPASVEMMPDAETRRPYYTMNRRCKDCQPDRPPSRR